MSTATGTSVRALIPAISSPIRAYKVGLRLTRIVTDVVQTAPVVEAQAAPGNRLRCSLSEFPVLIEPQAAS